MTTDEEQRIIMANEAARYMFGYPVEEMHHQSIHLLIPADSAQAPVPGLPGYLGAGEAPGQTGGNIRLTGAKADGTRFPVEALISPVEVTGKKFFAIILRDISLRLQAEQQEKQLNQVLNRQNQQLQQFGYITSLNLRGPVATIQGLLNVVDKENLSNPQNTSIINHLATTTDHLDEIIRGLVQVLDYQTNYNAVYEAVRLEEVFSEVSDRLAQFVETANARVIADFSRLPEVWSVRSYIESLFYNLLINAIKYRSPERDPLIRIHSLGGNGYAELTVTDNGLGIDLQKHGQRLFGLYSRFHFHTGGKGLGLHLVKTQGEAMNGKIEIESREGEGTVCKVLLPVK